MLLLLLLLLLSQESEQEETEKSKEEKSSDEEEDEKHTLPQGQHLFSKALPRSLKKEVSSEDEGPKIDDAEKEQNLVWNLCVV